MGDAMENNWCQMQRSIFIMCVGAPTKECGNNLRKIGIQNQSTAAVFFDKLKLSSCTPIFQGEKGWKINFFFFFGGNKWQISGSCRNNTGKSTYHTYNSIFCKSIVQELYVPV